MRLTGTTAAQIDEQSVIAFFDGRARRAADAAAPHVTMLQDHQQALTEARDAVERRALAEALGRRPRRPARTLDVGCGAGRLFFSQRDRLGQHYVGVDGAPGLIEGARQRLAREPWADGQAWFEVQDLSQRGLGRIAAQHGPFDVVLCSGILIYLNDDSVWRLLRDAVGQAAEGATLILREPVGVHERLNLIDEWSDELGTHYSALYRTRDELADMVGEVAGDRLVRWTSQWLYDDPALNNRAETRQAWMVGTLE